MSSIKEIYSYLSKHSSLLWPSRSIALPKLRSQTPVTPPSPTSSIQYTYGETTLQSFHKLLLSLISLGLDSTSSFLDIGSGFGKPVFHTAFHIKCYCYGIEVVPARVEFCKQAIEYFSRKNKDKDIDFSETEKTKIQLTNDEKKLILDICRMLDEIEDEEDDEDTGDEEEWEEKVGFEMKDAGEWKKYEYYCEKDKVMKDYKFIYSYNKVMSIKCLERICVVLNNTDFKVLVWYWPEKETMKFGLKNVKMVKKMRMKTTGKESYNAYIYVKDK